MFDRLYDHKAYQEYKRTHAQLAAPGTASVVKQFSDANGLDGLEWFRENLVENISLSISMTELGVKWLLLHELGHAALGHLSQPSKEGHEREYAADRFATERFLPYLRARYDLSNVPITTAAVAALFVVIDFLEFIVKLANNCIRLSMPKDFRKGFRGIGWTHPSTSERANRILKSFPQFMDQLNNSWAEILEGGMLTVKRAIHLGLIDLRYFKRFCRISGQQMSAAYVMKSVAPGVKEKLAQVLSVYDDWDSADVNPGPLIDDVFEGVFNAPLFMRR
jgi:hypothetical protein